MSNRTVHLLDLSTAPTDAVERVFWLDGVMAKVREELGEAYSEAYFQARLEGRFEVALRVGRTSRTKALKMTRRLNEESGRSIRWADGADPTSTAYEG